ncbi:transglycosylase domain-containing protein [Atopococcus tabaci]|uniref:transglycosylase domain-containing protein n=1 Tax=Atopococcus tabaci TaxID=269774 RepID=UPI002409E563|nr:transglycosylase domain-containing protein [Atopococcus tabaci]
MKGSDDKKSFSLWKKIKETETFKQLEEDVKSMSDGLKDIKKHPSSANESSQTEGSQQTDDSVAVDNRQSETVVSTEQDSNQAGVTRKNRKDQTAKKEKLISFGKKAFHYFDISYGVIKSLAIFFIVLAVLGLAFVGGTGVGYFVSLVYGREIPPHEEMESEVTSVSSKSTIFYGTGEVLSDVRSDLKRTPIPIDEMSPHVLEAVVATEDEYFMEHKGIVPKAIARALIQEFAGSPVTSGGSTLTQQLIKQQLLTNETSFERKANEIMLAMRLEDTMEKEEILEAYMNVSPFGRNNRGENIAGVQEAARGIFGVNASELTVPQAAFLAGLPQSPISYSPYTQYGEIKEELSAGIERQKNVLFFMYRGGYLTKEEYEEAKNYDITQDFINRENAEENKQAFLYDSVELEAREILMELAAEEAGLTMAEIRENDELYNQYYEDADQELRMNGYNIYTTVHKNIHDAFQRVAAEHGDKLGSPRDVYWTDEETGEDYHMVEHVENGSVLLDNASGRVIAFVGGVNYDENQVNHAFYIKRQPASTLKPLIVFGPALELGVITPASMIKDSEVEVPSGSGKPHKPRNVGATTNRWMTARESLAVSQNIPATKIFMEMYKKHDLKPFLRNAGLGPDSFPDNVFNYASLAIGGAGQASVLEMAGAFSSIANSGTHVEPFLIERIETKGGDVIFEHEQASAEVFSPETAFLLQDMLRDTNDTGTARGTEERLNFEADIISKTGTSNDNRDVWYLASTPEVTLASWMGYDNKIKFNDLRTENGQYPALRNRIFWAHLMNALHETNPTIIGANATFQKPDTVVEEEVLAATGMKPGKVELPDGSTTNISGETRKEFFNKKFVPGTTTYDFGIYAKDSELKDFWKGFDRSDSDQDSNNEDEGSDNSENNEANEEETNGNNESNNEEAPEEERE